jgi:Putative peptidoglycan binding domain
MTSKRSLRWTCALVVTAAVALIPGAAASSATAQARSAAPLLEAPSPSAGWHGGPIRRPLPRREEARDSTPRAGPELAVGAGYERPDGSAAVRALQRVLLGLGYACGSADGLFGPRTQASVAWFQIKHGLRPTGVADAATLEVVRARDRARSGRTGEPAARPDAPAPRTAPAAAPQAPRSGPVRDRREAIDRSSGGIGVLALVLLLAAGGALLSLLATIAWRHARRGDVAQRARGRARAVARFLQALLRRRGAPAADGAGAEPGETSGNGYANGRDAPRLERPAAAIPQAYSDRRETPAPIVREHGSTAVNGHTAPTAAPALDRMASGAREGLAGSIATVRRRLGR